MKFLKNGMTILMVIVLCMTCSLPAIAEESIMNGFGNPTPEDLEENDRIITLKERESRNNDINEIVYTNIMLPVPYYAQEYSYYCAPACVQMVIKYLTGTYYSQSILASLLGTTTSGTYVYMVAQVLNNLKTNDGYYYGYNTIYQKDIIYAFRYAISRGYPVIPNVLTTTLNNLYSLNNLSPSGHYIVVKGYNYAEDNGGNITRYYGENPMTPQWHNFTYLEPFDLFGFGGSYTIPSSQMNSAIAANTGYFIW